MIVFHDEDLLRMTTSPEKIRDMDYANLPKIKNSPINVNFWDKDYTAQSFETDKSIPLLEDLFIAVPKLPILLELKEGNLDLAREVMDLIR